MADFFGIFNPFLCQWTDSQMLRGSYKKVSLSFTIISCAAAATRKFINRMRAKVFKNAVFEFK